MNTIQSIIEEYELLELTDVELENACGGWSISQSFNPGANIQTNGYANSSFGNAYFGNLASNQGGFQIGGSAQSSNYYNYIVSIFPGK